ncbi:MAG: gamma-glutamyl-gamma-aminobutyrate hydrolase family protein [Planctomycetota bacterium]|nr:gamma-glutamyl-gamma-aminobutyrate hydrolase family protein [Planctomycetota bacterium]
MKPILVFQHVPHEGLGLLAELFQQRELSVRQIDVLKPGALADLDRERILDDSAGLVILGGPMNVDQTEQFPALAEELHWIRSAIEQQLPVLGICLGSQLLAKALGAKVYPNKTKEIGWYPLDLTDAGMIDPLFVGSARQETVFQWHGDTFDLPDGSRLLATSPVCRAQAFGYGANAYGLQFHMEVSTDMVETWLEEPENSCEVAALDYIDPAKIRAELVEALPRMLSFGRRVFGRFADLCQQQSQV